MTEPPTKVEQLIWRATDLEKALRLLQSRANATDVWAYIEAVRGRLNDFNVAFHHYYTQRRHIG